jgi:hypothetical protein
MNDAVKPKTWKVVLCTKGEIQLPREIAEHAGGYISFDPTVSIGVGVLNSNRPMRWLRLHLVLRYVQSETGKAIRSRRRFYIAGSLLLLPNGGITANDLSGLDLKDRTLEVRQQMVTGLDGGPEFVIDLLPLYTKVQAMRARTEHVPVLVGSAEDPNMALERAEGRRVSRFVRRLLCRTS